MTADTDIATATPTATGIRYVLDGHVARVTIDRPAVRNALDAAANAELGRIWDEVERDDRVRVVVLTGAGDRAFCAGADMSGGTDGDEGPSGLEYWASAPPDGFGGLALRATLDVPVIARINGYALGGGLELALGCDILIAADDARLGLPEARVGRVPLDGGVGRLLRQVPYHQAMGLLLTGRQVTAVEAAAMGLVTVAVPAAELDTTVAWWVDQVLACAPLSLRAIKQWAQRGAHLSAREMQALRVPALVAALRSTDSVEGVRAFREKRVPVWEGR